VPRNLFRREGDFCLFILCLHTRFFLRAVRCFPSIQMSLSCSFFNSLHHVSFRFFRTFPGSLTFLFVFFFFCGEGVPFSASFFFFVRLGEPPFCASEFFPPPVRGYPGIGPACDSVVPQSPKNPSGSPPHPFFGFYPVFRLFSPESLLFLLRFASPLPLLIFVTPAVLCFCFFLGTDFF